MAWECQTLGIDEAGRLIAADNQYRDKDLVQSLFFENSTNLNLRTGTAVTRPSWFQHKSFAPTIIRSLLSSHDGLPGSDNFSKYLKGYDWWYGVVREYMRRNISYGEDILPAIGGIAAGFQNFLRDRYVAGLWERDLVRDLLWSMTVEPALDHEEKPDFTAPSWSWASVPHARNIIFHHPNNGVPWFVKTYQHANVIKVECTPKIVGKPFGQITEGYLLIKGRLYAITDPRVGEPDPDNSLKVGRKLVPSTAAMPEIEACVRTTFFDDEYQYQHRDCEGQSFALLQIMRWADENATRRAKNSGAKVLILESTGKGKDQYRRLGRFTFDRNIDAAKWDVEKMTRELDGNTFVTKTIRLV